MLRERDRTNTVGPVLRDGTPLSELIDIQRREVSERVFADPEIYELELEHLFAKAWFGIAHESEIPDPGDYVTRHIGNDVVLVNRGADRTVNVMLNVCTHRGMQVCRAEVGNATKFRCPYHGWVFGQDGTFLAAPFEKEMYGDCLDKGALGLQRARVETWGGIVFATWDLTAPSLDDYLGEVRWYLDALWNRTDSGLEVVGAPQHFLMRANWKVASEQWAGDGYHANTLHRSIQDLGFGSVGEETMFGVDVSSHAGHGFRCFHIADTFKAILGDADAGASAIDKLRALPPPGMTAEMVEQMPRHLDSSQLNGITKVTPGLGQLFPNTFVWNTYGFSQGRPSAITRMHTTVPRGPDEFSLMSLCFVERDAPDELKAQIARDAVFASGTSGFVEQDDADMWPAVQRATRGFMARRNTLKYQAFLGVQNPSGWGGGGLVYDGFTKDDNQWNWWVRYLEFMTGAAW